MGTSQSINVLESLETMFFFSQGLADEFRLFDLTSRRVYGRNEFREAPRKMTSLCFSNGQSSTDMDNPVIPIKAHEFFCFISLSQNVFRKVPPFINDGGYSF
jgi:hypothetical protein